MALRVAFVTTLGANVGDEIIREGVRAALDAAGLPYVPFYIDKHDRGSLGRPVEDEPQATTDKYWDADVVIQAGAPVYWHVLGGRSTSLNCDWAGWLWRDRVLVRDGRPQPVFLNLGAGSSQPWGDTGRAFLADEACRAFARDLGRAAALTIVRDPVASGILDALGVAHHALPCPALLASSRHQPLRGRTGFIGVNLMPLGAHHDVDGTFDRVAWLASCTSLVRQLRGLQPVVFVAHDPVEREFLQQLCAGGERVAYAPSWRDYLDIYAELDAVVANRVHGALCAAGFGVPAVILGNDTRATIGDFIGLPVFRSGTVPASEVVQTVARLLNGRESERSRLVELRDRTLERYAGLLRSLVLPERERPAAGGDDARAGQVAVSFADDWHAAEWDRLGVWRWSPGASTVDVHVSQGGVYVFDGEIAVLEPRSVVVEVDGQPAAATEIRSPRPVALTLLRVALEAGHHRIVLRTDRPPSTVPGDARPLGFLLRNARVTAVASDVSR